MDAARTAFVEIADQERSKQSVIFAQAIGLAGLATFWTSGRPRPTDSTAHTLTQKLSNRESDILRCLIDGSSNKAIARRLAITESTVKVHMKSLLRKLNAANRTQAAIWGMEAGFGSGLDTGNVDG